MSTPDSSARGGVLDLTSLYEAGETDQFAAIEGTVSDAMTDRQAVQSPWWRLWTVGTLETFVPRKRARVLPKVLLLMGLGVLCLPGAPVFVQVFGRLAAISDAAGSGHGSIAAAAAGMMFAIGMMATVGVALACIYSAFVALGGLRNISVDEKEALAEWLKSRPYRRDIVRGWLTDSDVLLRIDAKAARALPTAHAKLAGEILRRSRDDSRIRRDVEATAALRR